MTQVVSCKAGQALGRAVHSIFFNLFSIEFHNSVNKRPEWFIFNSFQFLFYDVVGFHSALQCDQLQAVGSTKHSLA